MKITGPTYGIKASSPDIVRQQNWLTIVQASEYVSGYSLYEASFVNRQGTDPSGFYPKRGGCWQRLQKQRDREHEIDGCSAPLLGDGPFDFFDPCAQHDICYQTCGSSKGGCDGDLKRDIVRHCSNYPSGWYMSCIALADVYYLGVQYGGFGPYNQRQNEYCDWEETCCPCKDTARPCEKSVNKPYSKAPPAPPSFERGAGGWSNLYPRLGY